MLIVYQLNTDYKLFDFLWWFQNHRYTT